VLITHESSDADNDDREEEDKDEESEVFIEASDNQLGGKVSNAQKRKFSDFDGQLNVANTSLRALKRLAEAKRDHLASDKSDGILSNEDFQRIKELKVCLLLQDQVETHKTPIQFLSNYYTKKTHQFSLFK